jgi:hypothetical protein
MIVSIHQSNFVPWYPFFQKIDQSDIFVIMGHCQFEKNNFQNRFNLNDKWHTMSVNKGLEPIVNKRYLNPEKDWNRIKVNLKQYSPVLDELDDCISDNLFETNVSIIKKLCVMLDIQTEIVTDYPTDLKRTERLVDICKHYGATKYLSGPSGKNYLDLSQFGDSIDVMYQSDQEKKSVLETL